MTYTYRRQFEIISKEQWLKDKQQEGDYYNILLPRRATDGSAGYDFYAPYAFEIKPGEKVKIYTGIKCSVCPDEVLKCYVRSSMGIKYDIELCNTVGIIDSDYYNNIENEGHIIAAFRNTGDKIFTVNVGDRILQGIILEYKITDDDNPIQKKRTGGIGSTTNK